MHCFAPEIKPLRPSFLEIPSFLIQIRNGWTANSSFSFELGMREFQGIKDANALFVPQMKSLCPLIPFDSSIPNSNKKRLDSEMNAR
jgi:hypothetical protein